MSGTVGHLVYMANQIARNFAIAGHDAAVASTAEHLRQFWDPRMKRLILGVLDAGGEGLEPIARDAVGRLRG